MLKVIVNMICSILCATTIVYTTLFLTESKNIFSKIRIIISIALISIIIFLSAKIDYNVESILFKMALCIIVLKIIYKYSMYKTIMIGFLSMLLLLISDLISTFIFINFITVQEMRGIWYWILICNIAVYIITFIIIYIPIIKTKIKTFINNLNEDGILSSIIIIVFSSIIIIYLLYNISINYEWNEKYIINIVIAITYILIIIVFLKDKSDYNNLMIQYDTLFEYFKELENNIDEISLVNHEYKNQLSVLKSYIKNNNKKEAIDYINSIIQASNVEDKSLISEIKNIPKGGIKGLLYYKIITAKNKKIQVTLNISKNVESIFKKLTPEENRLLSKILGVYIDNSIEAVLPLKKKLISIEIYMLNEKLNIVISNLISNNNINLSNLNKRGYTTKGKGHGRGLYLIKKIINKSNNFNNETKIINNYFIQKVEIIK